MVSSSSGRGRRAIAGGEGLQVSNQPLRGAQDYLSTGIQSAIDSDLVEERGKHSHLASTTGFLRGRQHSRSLD